MVEPRFALSGQEAVLKESSDHHFLRPDASLVGRLCHPFLTSTRLVLCEAYYDVLKAREKGVGGIIHEIPVAAIEALRASADAAEPHIELDVREQNKGLAKLVLFFRDAGWAQARPQRLSERDEWIAAINDQRGKLGLPVLQIATQPAGAPAAPPAIPASNEKDLVGTTLAGKYEILKHIGSGGMGLVYEGKDKTLDRLVAVKRMRPEVGMTGRDKTLFLREAKTSAALHHPFIVDIYSILDEGAEIFLVFEYVDGQTMQERMDEKGPFKAAVLKPLLKCICEALSYAHGERFSHRDLKPSNIMITKQGYAKVMDFGIARMLKDTASRTTKLDTSGTMPYMAPEQELGKGDSRADIFALGATVYELLSGELPYRGPNFYLQKEKGERKPLLEIAPATPPELAAAVDKCLEFDPKNRFQTVAEFAQAVGVA